MPSPHADFACLSKKCATDAGATVYDLPVKTTRCPVCGSKRIAMLFNAINVATKGIGKFVDPLIEPVFDRQGAVQDAASRHPAVVHGPASNMGALLAKAMHNVGRPDVAPAFSQFDAGPNKPGRPADHGRNPVPGAALIRRGPRAAPGSPSVSRQELGM